MRGQLAVALVGWKAKEELAARVQAARAKRHIVAALQPSHLKAAGGCGTTEPAASDAVLSSAAAAARKESRWQAAVQPFQA